MASQEISMSQKEPTSPKSNLEKLQMQLNSKNFPNNHDLYSFISKDMFDEGFDVTKDEHSLALNTASRKMTLEGSLDLTSEDAAYKKKYWQALQKFNK